MRTISRAGAIGAVLHLAILAVNVSLILRAASHPAADWTRYWVLFLALDFPVSLGTLPVVWLVPPSAAGPLGDFTNFWWPLAWHGIVGTGWWYIVGWAIARKIARFRRRDESDHLQRTRGL